MDRPELWNKSGFPVFPQLFLLKQYCLSSLAQVDTTNPEIHFNFSTFVSEKMTSRRLFLTDPKIYMKQFRIIFRRKKAAFREFQNLTKKYIY